MTRSPASDDTLNVTSNAKAAAADGVLAPKEPMRPLGGVVFRQETSCLELPSSLLRSDGCLTSVAIMAGPDGSRKEPQ